MPFFQTHSKSLIFYLQNPELYSPTIIFMMIAIIIVTAGYGNRQIIVIDKNILNIAVIKIYGLITNNFTSLFLTGNQHLTFKYR